jgi:hypothetical protein
MSCNSNVVDVSTTTKWLPFAAVFVVCPLMITLSPESRSWSVADVTTMGVASVELVMDTGLA